MATFWKYWWALSIFTQTSYAYLTGNAEIIVLGDTYCAKREYWIHNLKDLLDL